jgi:NAD kinase
MKHSRTWALSIGNGGTILKTHHNIQPVDMPKIIHARVGPTFLAHYDTVDLEHLLGRWCSEEYRVRRS